MDTRNTKRLAKFLAYVLGRRPDEFGLLPDARGFIKVTELLQALSTEADWRWVRQAHLRELVLTTLKAAPIELQDKHVRAVQRQFNPQPRIDITPPKLLYTGIRKRAHGVVMQNGIRPLGGREWVLLCAQRAEAEQIGQRLDRHAILLTVNIAQAETRGVQFKLFGELLWLAREIPAGCFSGPPLAVDNEPLGKGKHSKPPASPATPGSFTLNPTVPDSRRPDSQRPFSQRKDKKWKRDRQKARRQKQHGWE